MTEQTRPGDGYAEGWPLRPCRYARDPYGIYLDFCEAHAAPPPARGPRPAMRDDGRCVYAASVAEIAERLVAERDRARATAVALEQQLAYGMYALAWAEERWPATSWAHDAEARQVITDTLQDLRAVDSGQTPEQEAPTNGR